MYLPTWRQNLLYSLSGTRQLLRKVRPTVVEYSAPALDSAPLPELPSVQALPEIYEDQQLHAEYVVDLQVPSPALELPFETSAAVHSLQPHSAPFSNPDSFEIQGAIEQARELVLEQPPPRELCPEPNLEQRIQEDPFEDPLQDPLFPPLFGLL